MANNKDSKGIIIIIGIVSILLLVVVLNAGNSSFVAKTTSSDGTVSETEIREPLFGEIQSFFSDISTQNILQSFDPAGDQDLVELSAVVKNDFGLNLILSKARIIKNSNQLYEDNIGLLIQNGQDYIYSTEPIDLVGLDSQINTIQILFIFIDEQGKEYMKQFEYRYYSMTECRTQSDCQTPNNVCDIENIAGFSIDNTHYCVKPCTDNTQCYPNQVCKSGRCGY